MAIKPEVVDFINSHAESVISEAKSALATDTSKEVDVQFQEAAEFDLESITSNYDDSVVDISFKLESDPEGIIHVYIDKATAALIGSLIMMMEEEKPEFEAEMHLDSTKEVFSHVLGGLKTNLPGALGVPFNFTDVEAAEFTFDADSFTQPDLVSVKFTIGIGDADPKTYYSVMTSSTIESLMSDSAGEEDAAEDTAEGEAVEEPGTESENDLGEAITQPELSEDEMAEITAAMGEELGGMEIPSQTPGGSDADMFGEGGGAPPAAPEAPEVMDHIKGEEKLDMLLDLTFPVSIELGRTKMLIKDILDLGHGSVIEFDKLASQPVDLLVDDKKVAEGEVVVIDEHFGIRLTSIVKKAEWMKALEQTK